MKLKNILVVYASPTAKEQKLTLETVKKAIKKHKINYELAARDRLSKARFRNKDLIIAVGGDGTFLRAAIFTDKQALLGVNSDVKNKEGFFMKSDKKDFEAKLKRIINGKIKI